MKKPTTRKAKDLNKVPHPPVRKETMKDLDPGVLGIQVKGGSIMCGCTRSR
ncbi:MAG: hypothetical protein U0Q55_23205 [Vicinamibacterales bacterium]